MRLSIESSPSSASPYVSEATLEWEQLCQGKISIVVLFYWVVVLAVKLHIIVQLM